MTAPVRNDDDTGLRVVAVLLMVLAVMAVVLLATGPEPALHEEPVTPATAAPAVPFQP